MDKRKFPRQDIRTQQRILCLSPRNQLDRTIVLSKNLSASGFCFRSPKSYEKGDEVLVYLNEDICEDIKLNKGRVMKSGNYLLARVVWVTPASPEDKSFHEIGCEFIGLNEGTMEKVDYFTKLVNRDTVDQMIKIPSA